MDFCGFLWCMCCSNDDTLFSIVADQQRTYSLDRKHTHVHTHTKHTNPLKTLKCQISCVRVGLCEFVLTSQL